MSILIKNTIILYERKKNYAWNPILCVYEWRKWKIDKYLNNCTYSKGAVYNIAITCEKNALKITIINISAEMAFGNVFLGFVVTE